MTHGPRQLREFLRATEKTQRWLAGELGISGAHMSNILAGKDTPSLNLARRIERLTGIPAGEFASEAA